MVVERLSATNFRNFRSLEAAFSSGVNVFFGENGSGKTNLLEAIFVLCLGRSQRTAADSVLINNGQEFYRLEGSVRQDGRSQQLAVAYQRSGRKKITLDGVAIKLAELFETVCAVSSGPEDSDILSGGPSVRRTFLDIYLSQYSRAYLDNLKDYYRALAQKNAALKQEMECSAYNELLCTYGSRIMKTRLEFIEAMRAVAVKHYADISGGEQLELRYEPSVPLGSGETELAQIEAAFDRALKQGYARERAAQMTLIGPHRDELEISISGYPARTHGSQGQWRTAAVSLKLSVYELLREKRKVAPVLLLDEIFAELDVKRAHGLIEAFGDYRQLFLTTASEPPEPLRANGRRYRIQKGMIEDVS